MINYRSEYINLKEQYLLLKNYYGGAAVIAHRMTMGKSKSHSKTSYKSSSVPSTFINKLQSNNLFINKFTKINDSLSYKKILDENNIGISIFDENNKEYILIAFNNSSNFKFVYDVVNKLFFFTTYDTLTIKQNYIPNNDIQNEVKLKLNNIIDLISSFVVNKENDFLMHCKINKLINMNEIYQKQIDSNYCLTSIKNQINNLEKSNIEANKNIVNINASYLTFYKDSKIKEQNNIINKNNELLVNKKKELEECTKTINNIKKLIQQNNEQIPKDYKNNLESIINNEKLKEIMNDTLYNIYKDYVNKSILSNTECNNIIDLNRDIIKLMFNDYYFINYKI